MIFFFHPFCKSVVDTTEGGNTLQRDVSELLNFVQVGCYLRVGKLLEKSSLMPVTCHLLRHSLQESRAHSRLGQCILNTPLCEAALNLRTDS